MKSTHLTEKSFHRFKRWARMCMSRLNPKKPAHLQGIKWEQFVEDMLVVEPELVRYDHYWPLTFYYDFCHVRRSRFTTTNRMLTPPEEIIDIDDSDTDSDSRESDIIWINDKPTIITAESSANSSSTFGPPRRLTGTSPGLGNLNQPAMSPAPSPPVPDLSILPTGQKPTLDDSYIIRNIYAPCIFCGAQVTDLPYNAKLRTLVGRDRFIKILSSYGIQFDQHLDILLRMDNKLKIILFQNFQMGGISPLTRFQLYRLFNTSSKPGIPAEAPIDALFISPPSLEIQTKLSSSDLSTADFGSLLKNALKLDNDDGAFDDILGLMDFNTRSLFFTHALNIEHVEEVIKLITQQRRPQFGRYHNYWPIRLYINRRKAILGTTSQFTKEEEEAAYASIFNADMIGGLLPQTSKSEQEISSVPSEEIENNKIVIHLEQIPCKLHPPIDISGATPKLKEYLDGLGMTELIPALVYVGFATDNDLDTLSKLGIDELTTIVEFGKVKLSDFQKFMLKIAFPCKASS